MLNHVPQEAAQGSVSLKERPKQAKRRWYSEQDKADAVAAVAMNGGNLWSTSKKLGISWQNLHNWVKAVSGPESGMLPIATPRVIEASKRDYAQALLATRWLYLDRATEPDAVAKTSGYYAAVTTKILTEQHQLLTGGATSRTELSLSDFLRGSSLALGGSDHPLGGGETNREVGGG